MFAEATCVVCVSRKQFTKQQMG